MILEYIVKNKIYVFALLHVLIWTLLPTILHPNMPLDMTELVSWGHEWQWGYQKHPPLSSWIAEVAMILSGNSTWAYFLLSQISIATSFIIVWKLSGKFLDKEKAFMATILLEGVYYYNFTSPEFNPNVLMIPLWSAIILAFWNGLQTSKIQYWFFVGLLSALAMLAKYYSATLLISMVLMLVFAKDYRSHWRTAGPYVAFVTAMLCLLPHLMWIYQNNFSTFHYAIGRSSSEYHFYNHLLYPLKFSLSQLVSVLAALVIFGVAYSKERGRSRHILNGSDNKLTFLFFCGLMPFLLTLLISGISSASLKSMWGTPLWNLVGIMLFYFFYKENLSERFSKVFYKTFIIIVVISVVAYIGSLTFRTSNRAHFNGQAAGKYISDAWNQAVPDMPLKIVVGDLWLAGNIGFYADSRLSVFTDMDTQKSSWLNIDRLRQAGAVIVWDSASEGERLPARLTVPCTKILLQNPVVLPWRNGDTDKPPYMLGFAILVPVSKYEKSEVICDSKYN